MTNELKELRTLVRDFFMFTKDATSDEAKLLRHRAEQLLHLDFENRVLSSPGKEILLTNERGSFIIFLADGEWYGSTPKKVVSGGSLPEVVEEMRYQCYPIDEWLNEYCREHPVEGESKCPKGVWEDGVFWSDEALSELEKHPF